MRFLLSLAVALVVGLRPGVAIAQSNQCRVQRTATVAERVTQALMASPEPLSLEQAQKLELSLLTVPDDAVTHALLARPFRGEVALAGRPVSHLLWLIEHTPDAELIGLESVRAARDADAAGLLERAWVRAAELPTASAATLANAANFFLSTEASPTSRELGIAESYLLRAMRLDPASSEYPLSLGFLYSRQAEETLGTKRVALAAQAFHAYETSLNNEYDVLGRARRMALAAGVALQMGEPAIAANYAQWALDMVQRHRDRQAWAFDAATYVAKLVQGTLALRRGNIARAKQLLQEAGTLHRQSVPRSDGDVGGELVLGLLNAGERDAVLRFVDEEAQALAEFPSEVAKLRKWPERISAGQSPWN